MPHEQNQDPYVGLYADALGRGVVVAHPVAAPNAAQINQQSLRPQGGIDQGLVNASPSFLGGPTDAVAASQAAQGRGQEEEQNEDYLANLFNGEMLTEAFKEKARVLFNAALSEKVAIMEQAILQANAEVLKEELTAGIQEGLGSIVESVDEYLTHVSREWLVENKLEVEAGFRTEIAENFINGLKDLFENSFIEVPEEKRDLVDDLFETNEKIETQLNGAIQENIQLRAAVTAQLCAEQFMNIASGLAQTEVERLATLSENLEFSSVEQYTQKVQLLKESYFGNGSYINKPTDDGSSSMPNTPVNTNNSPLMEGYVNAISRHLKLTNIKR